jgi:hypothetical protein
MQQASNKQQDNKPATNNTAINKATSQQQARLQGQQQTTGQQIRLQASNKQGYKPTTNKQVTKILRRH